MDPSVHGSVLMDPYRWGWPAVGPVTCFATPFVSNSCPKLQRSVTAPALIASPAGRTPTHPTATHAADAGAVPGGDVASAEKDTIGQYSENKVETPSAFAGGSSASCGDNTSAVPEAPNPSSELPQLEKSLKGEISAASAAPAFVRMVTPLLSDATVASRAAPGLERATSLDDRLLPFPPPRRALYGPANDPGNNSNGGSGGASNGGRGSGAYGGSSGGGVTVATRHGGSRQGSPRFTAGSRGRGSSDKKNSTGPRPWNASPGRRSGLAHAFEPTPMEIWLEIPVGDEHFTMCRLWAPPRDAMTTAEGGEDGAAAVELDEGRAAASWVRDLALEFGLSPAEEGEVWGSVRRQIHSHLSRVALRRAAAEAECYGDPMASSLASNNPASAINGSSATSHGKRLPPSSDARPGSSSQAGNDGHGGPTVGSHCGGGGKGVESGQRKQTEEGHAQQEGRSSKKGGSSGPIKMALASISGKGNGKGSSGKGRSGKDATPRGSSGGRGTGAGAHAVPEAMATVAPQEEKWVEFAVLDHNTDVCGTCGRGGDLLCCDQCPRAFHVECLGVNEEDLPDGDWVCGGCDEDAALWMHEPLLQWPTPRKRDDSSATTTAMQEEEGVADAIEEGINQEPTGGSMSGAASTESSGKLPKDGLDKSESSEASSSSSSKSLPLQRGLALVELLLRHDFAQPFAAPIDPVGLGLSRYDEIVERRIDLGTVLKRARLAVAASSSSATTSTSPRSSTMEGGKDSSPRSNSKGVKTRPVQSKKNNAKEGSTFSRSFSSDRGAATAGEEASEEALEPYKSCVELVEDCRVTFHNCVVYNAEGSAIVRMAKYLDKMCAAVVERQLLPLLSLSDVTHLEAHTLHLKNHAAAVVLKWGKPGSAFGEVQVAPSTTAAAGAAKSGKNDVAPCSSSASSSSSAGKKTKAKNESQRVLGGGSNIAQNESGNVAASNPERRGRGRPKKIRVIEGSGQQANTSSNHAIGTSRSSSCDGTRNDATASSSSPKPGRGVTIRSIPKSPVNTTTSSSMASPLNRSIPAKGSSPESASDFESPPSSQKAASKKRKAVPSELSSSSSATSRLPLNLPETTRSEKTARGGAADDGNSSSSSSSSSGEQHQTSTKRPKRSRQPKCEKCDEQHDGSFGSGRFCSQTCRSLVNGRARSVEKRKITSASPSPLSAGSGTVIGTTTAASASTDHLIQPPNATSKATRLGSPAAAAAAVKAAAATATSNTGAAAASAAGAGAAGDAASTDKATDAVATLPEATVVSPQRLTREAMLFNAITLGTSFLKDFGATLGVFRGEVVALNYPYASVRYEDGDVEDFGAAELFAALDKKLQKRYQLQYESQIRRDSPRGAKNAHKNKAGAASSTKKTHSEGTGAAAIINKAAAGDPAKKKKR